MARQEKDDNMKRKERSDMRGIVCNAFHAFSGELLFMLVFLIAFIGLLRVVGESPYALKVGIVVGAPLVLTSLCLWILRRGVRKNVISRLEVVIAIAFVLSYFLLRYLARHI